MLGKTHPDRNSAKKSLQFEAFSPTQFQIQTGSSEGDITIVRINPAMKGQELNVKIDGKSEEIKNVFDLQE